MSEAIKFNVRDTVSKDVSETVLTLVETKVVNDELVTDKVEIKVMGKMTKEQATKFIAKEYKGRAVLVLSTVVDTKTYEMPLEVFLSNATIKEAVVVETAEVTEEA